jgi:hypothetical protein
MSQIKTIFCPNVVHFESNETDLNSLNDFKDHPKVLQSRYGWRTTQPLHID